MIVENFLDPRNVKGERSLKLIEESEIDVVKLFGESNLRSVMVRKNLPKWSKKKFDLAFEDLANWPYNTFLNQSG